MEKSGKFQKGEIGTDELKPGKPPFERPPFRPLPYISFEAIFSSEDCFH